MKKIPYAFFLLAPSASFALGLLMNMVVMAANHAQMPVLMPGGVCPGDLDTFHTCMTAATHLKWLADWAVFEQFIASPGDLFITIGEATTYPSLLVWATLLVQKVNSVGR